MVSMLEAVSVPQPHFIPGYTGYCPQYMFRCGNTYGTTTHKVLIDPNILHAENLVLADRTYDEYQVYRPAQRDIDVVKARDRYGDTIYKHPMMAGYEGFVPRMNNQFGQSYSVAATSAMAAFQLQQYKDRKALQHLKILGAAQDDEWDPRTLEDKTLVRSDYKMPMELVRPEQCGLVRSKPVTEPALEPPIQSKSPYFMDNNNPGKFIKQGATVAVPFGYSKFGASNEPMTNSALCDFTSNYRRRLATEWAPVNISRADPPLKMQPCEIYYKHMGMIPNYAGHTPGLIFRCGRTFTDDTRDCKRWLRGDFRV